MQLTVIYYNEHQRVAFSTRNSGLWALNSLNLSFKETRSSGVFALTKCHLPNSRIALRPSEIMAGHWSWSHTLPHQQHLPRGRLHSDTTRQTEQLPARASPHRVSNPAPASPRGVSNPGLTKPPYLKPAKPQLPFP